MGRMLRAVLAAGALTVTAACGGTTLPASTDMAPTAQGTDAPIPTVSASATATPAGAVLAISQLGLSMTIPAHLSHVDYAIQKPSVGPLTDTAGVQHTALDQLDFSSPDCPGADLIVTVWSVDPVTLQGSGYGTEGATADTHAGPDYLHVEAPGASAPQACAEPTLGLLTQMVATATPTS